MFDYPLPISRDTLYERLGLEPEASADEIRDAKTEALVRIRDEIASIDRQLAAVNQAVPGLVDAHARMRRLQRDSDGGAAADARGLADARRQLAISEERAQQANPRYQELRRRADQLAREEIELNNIPLDRPEGREAYDAAHPPLALLKLTACARDQFVENRHAIHLIRRELTAFLTEQGEEVFHPSDLTREDFSNDYVRHSLLDGPDA